MRRLMKDKRREKEASFVHEMVYKGKSAVLTNSLIVFGCLEGLR